MTKSNSMLVTLAHASNPDIDGGSWGTPGYWQDGNPDAPKGSVKVESFRDAAIKCSRYINDNALGGGNWTGGKVMRDGKQVARISYNGRVWDMEGKEIAI